MSHLFLIKELEGYAATFLRFDGPDRFIIQVHGAERTISRDAWRALPERAPTQMLAHVHDAEIEIGEGPAPPREGPVQ
jgi:hypothetical protein